MSTVLAVAGVLLTIVFGVWAIYLAIRTRYPGRCTFLVHDEIELFTQIVNAVPDVAVTFRGKPVTPGLVLVKASLVNDGLIDILPVSVERPIALHLPESYQLIDARVSKASSEVTATVRAEQNIVTLDLGLFRRRERVELDLIVQVDLNQRWRPTDVAHALTVSQRIANMESVQVRDGRWAEPTQRRYKNLSFAISSLLLLSTALAIALFLPQAFMQLEFATSYGGKVRWVTAYPEHNDLVELVGVDDKAKTIIPAKLFFVTRAHDIRTRSIAWYHRVVIICIVGAISVPSWQPIIFNLLLRRRQRRGALVAGDGAAA